MFEIIIFFFLHNIKFPREGENVFLLKTNKV